MEITEEQFRDLKRARKRLSSAFAITHKFRLVAANFEMVKAAMEELGQLYVSQAEHERLEQAKPHLNACVNNLVLSARIFTSQLKRHVQGCLPQDRDIVESLAEKMEQEYRRSFAYRFIDSLYDYVANYGISIHTLKTRSFCEPDETGMSVRHFEFNAYIEKDYIGGPGEFRVSVFDEVGGKVNLIQVLEEFYACLSRLHDFAMNALTDVVHRSNATIQEFVNVFISEHGIDHINLFVEHTTQSFNHKVYDKFPISMYVHNHNMSQEYI